MNYEDVESLFGARKKGPEEAKYFRYKLKKIWYDHVKRRPEIDKRMEPLRKAAWDKLQMRFPISERKAQPRLG